MRNGLDSNGRLNGRLEDLVLGDLLAARAETHKEETFLEFRDGGFTYGEVDQMSNRVAQGLIAAGVRPGHHVAVMLPNCPELVFVIFALARLGAVAVP
ncbi:MAG TPA: AMP-binding protein, partial [Pseudonocardia sp.]|uniref:AMP-binding protein n=1 Tax=Pseudonocardia sp. TaxID=60912 RepID=UPI002BCD446D